ncbi:MAG: SCO family protein [Aggregatilineales bacterium]
MQHNTNETYRRAGLAIFAIAIFIGILGIGFSILTRDEDNPITEDTTAETKPCAEVDKTLDDGGIATFAPGCTLENFTFSGTEGDPISLTDLNGKLALVYFGYTHCPDFCPPTMLDFQNIHDRLGELSEQVEFVFITVDPARDTAESLGDYLSRYEPYIRGLVGDDAELSRIASDFDLTYEAQPADASGNYTVDHTISRYLIDENGALIRRYSFAISMGTIANDIETILNG